MKKAAAMGVLFLTLLLSGCTQETAVQGGEEKIVLTVLAGQSTSDAGVEDMIDEWMAEQYPDVKLEWECVDWGERFHSQMQGKIASGNVPDIMIGKAQDVKNYAETGALGEVPAACVEKIKPDALEAVKEGGKAYGIPYSAWYQGVIYNKNVFKDLGLAVPKTKKELRAAIQVLKDNGTVPFASHFLESWNVGNMTMQSMMNEIFCDMPDWGERFRAGEVNFTGNRKIMGCMKNNKEIMDASWEDALLLNQFESDSRFSQGEAAMYLTGSWSMQFADQYGEDIHFGIFPFPNQKGDADLIREINMTFMKSADTKYAGLIDRIFLSILEDEKLAREILEFTQSASVVKGISQPQNSKVQEDIDYYEKRGQITDVSAGNAQLVWEFQNSVADEQLKWLKGEQALEEVLEYADANRAESSYAD